MRIIDQAPILDDILESWRVQLGRDFPAYRNHCYRILNFCLALSGERYDALDKVSIAAAFHDLGIWTAGTFDYLEPSRHLAVEYLAKTSQPAWSEEIGSMIVEHHKLTKYRVNPDWLVETFRRADWIDVSKGKLRFGLPSDYLQAVLSKFPNAGFHKRLVALTRQRFRTHPLSPLPMMRL